MKRIVNATVTFLEGRLGTRIQGDAELVCDMHAKGCYEKKPGHDFVDGWQRWETDPTIPDFRGRCDICPSCGKILKQRAESDEKLAAIYYPL